MHHSIKIKGMVCRRCIQTVRTIFESEGLTVHDVELGEIFFSTAAWKEKEGKIKLMLKEEGFEVLDDKHAKLIQKVKEVIDNLLNDAEKYQKNYGQEISEAVNLEYSSISNLFAQTEGVTLEQYIIGKRIERVKEMISQRNLSLTDIAFQTGFSSVHHLSNQFKKITGLSPSAYQKLKNEHNL